MAKVEQYIYTAGGINSKNLADDGRFHVLAQSEGIDNSEITAFGRLAWAAYNNRYENILGFINWEVIDESKPGPLEAQIGLDGDFRNNPQDAPYRIMKGELADGRVVVTRIAAIGRIYSEVDLRQGNVFEHTYIFANKEDAELFINSGMRFIEGLEQQYFTDERDIGRFPEVYPENLPQYDILDLISESAPKIEEEVAEEVRGPEEEVKPAEEIEEPEEEVKPAEELNESVSPNGYKYVADSETKLNIKINGENRKQNIIFIEDNEGSTVSTLMNFTAPINDVNHDILSIYRNNKEEYWVEIKLPSAFLDSQGISLFDNPNFTKSNGTIILRVDKNKLRSTSPVISIQNNEDEFCANLRIDNGTEFKFNVNAAGINITINDNGNVSEYSYSAKSNGNSCVDAQINIQTIENMLSCKDDGLFGSFTSPKDMPPYVFKKYATKLEKNVQHNFGNGEKGFSIIPVCLDKKKTLFLTKDSSGKFYLYVSSSFKEINTFSFLRNDAGEISFVLSIDEKHYGFPFAKVQNNNTVEYTDPTAATFLGELLQAAGQQLIYNPTLGVSKNSPSLTILGNQDWTSEKHHDNRPFTRYRTNASVSFSYFEDEQEPDRLEESEKPKQPDKPQEPDKPQKPGDEPQKEKGGSEDKDPPAEPKDHKKAVEAFASSFAIIGVLMAIASLIPGIGPIMLVLGGSLFLGGTVLSLTAEQFKFSPYQAAKRKLAEYDDHQAKEFLEDEDTLESLIANSKEAAAEVERVSSIPEIEGGNPVAKGFMEAYDQNGISFVQEGDFKAREDLLNSFDQINQIEDPDERTRQINDFIATRFTDADANTRQSIVSAFESGKGTDLLQLAGLPLQSRHDHLLSLNGLAEREDMVKAIYEINNPANAENREQLINDFMFTHFDASANQEAIRELFSKANGENLDDFVSKIVALNQAQNEENDLYNKQKAALGNRTNDQIGRILGYKGLDSEKRKRVVERYGVTILKHLALDELTQEKVFEVLGDIPEQDRADVYEVFIKKSAEIERDANKIVEIAKDHKTTENNIDDLKMYGFAVKSITEDSTKEDAQRELTSGKSLREASTDFNMQYTAAALADTRATEVADWLINENYFSSEVESYTKIEEALGNATSEMITHSQNGLIQTFEKIESMADSLNINKNIGETQYSLYQGEPGQTLQPDMDDPTYYSTNLAYYELIKNEAAERIKQIDEEVKTASDEQKVSLNAEKTQLAEVIKACAHVNKSWYEFSTKESKQLIKTTFNVIKSELGLELKEFKSKGGKYYEEYNEAYNKLENSFSKEEKEYLAIMSVSASIKQSALDAEEETVNGNPSYDEDQKIQRKHEINDERQVYVKILAFVDLVNGNNKQTTNINFAIRSAAFKKHCENLGITLSEDELKKTARDLLRACTTKSHQDDLVSKFSEERQQKIMANLGESLRVEDFAATLRDAIGSDRVDANQPTFDEVAKRFNLDNAKEIDGKTVEQRFEGAFGDHTKHLNDLNQARTDNKLKPLEAVNGGNFVRTQYEYYLEHDKQEQDTQYNDIFDYLVKKFGIDRYKLIEEMAKLKSKDPTLTNDKILENLCKKFNIKINQAEIEKLDKKIYEKLYAAESDPKITLTADEQERVQLVINDSILKEFELTFKKFESLVVNNKFDELLTLCNDHIFKTLLDDMAKNFKKYYSLGNLQRDFMKVEDIVRLLESAEFMGASDEQKQKMFANLTKTINPIERGQRVFDTLRAGVDDEMDLNIKKLTQSEKDEQITMQINEVRVIDVKLSIIASLEEMLKDESISEMDLRAVIKELQSGSATALLSKNPELAPIVELTQDTLTDMFESYVVTDDLKEYLGSLKKQTKKERTQKAKKLDQNTVTAIESLKVTEEQYSLLSTTYNAVLGLKEINYTDEQIDEVFKFIINGEFDKLPEKLNGLKARLQNNAKFIKDIFKGKENSSQIKSVFKKAVEKMGEKWVEQRDALDKATENARKAKSGADMAKDEEKAKKKARTSNSFVAKVLENIKGIRHIVGVELSRDEARKEHEANVATTEQEYTVETDKETEITEDKENEE